MRPESGVSLVSGALQSSLTRAQRNYHFHGVGSIQHSHETKNQTTVNKNRNGVNKHLADYCNSIGSSFASYSADQFLALGNSLEFEDGGYLKQSIPDGVRKDCIILKQKQNDSAAGGSKKKNKLNSDNQYKKAIPSPLSNGEVHSTPIKNRSLNVSNSVVSLKSKDRQVEKSPTKENAEKLDKPIQKLLNLLKDKTIGKNKRKRLTRRLRQLERKKSEEIILSPIKQKQSLTVNRIGAESAPFQTTKAIKIKTKMGPESLKSEIALTNGTSSCLQLPEPKRILYPKEKIVLGWRNKRGPGAGFHNFGNTCYLNSSLQALFHIPAFVNWIQNDEEHRRICKGTLPNQTTCIICVVYFTLQEHSRNNSPIRPRVLDKLKAICKHFSYGRQEDAHEFLRYLLEGMERSFLTLVNGLRLDNRTKETNPLGQIFGGYIRTEVTCLQCNFVSTTFQPSAELQLDIRHSTTLEDALQLHFRREKLDNNDYRCEKCRKISQATKQFSLELPPLVLCLQLKRFTLYGNKIGKRIHCNKFLNMTRYLHKSQRTSGFYLDNELRYRFVALVTHLGQSPNCGHYTAIAEGSNGSYYQFDDQFVHEVSSQTALNNDAYLIIYEMDRNSQPGVIHSSVTNPGISSKPCTITSGSTIANGSPAGPRKFAIPFAKTNGSNGTSTPALKAAMMSNTDAINKNGPGSCIDRQVITFGLPSNSNPLVKSTAPATNKINILKPGVALTNSARLYSTSTPSTAKPIVPVAKCVSLVPYDAIDNDDDSDQEPKEEIRKSSPKAEKIIGPLIPSKALISKPTTPSGTNSTVNVQIGVKRKLDDILGPVPDAYKSVTSPSKKSTVNATSKWTITLKTGYSSDPENVSKKSKFNPGGFVRAKSMEKATPNISKPIAAPLIPNTKNKLNSSSQIGPSVPVIPLQVDAKSKGAPLPSKNVFQNGLHHSLKNAPSKKKRKRSSSSSSSSEEDRKKRKQEIKKKVKKEKRKSSKTSSSSSSDSDSSAGRHSDRKRHKNKRRNSKHRDESKEKIQVSNKSEANGWPPERDACSVEREQILRKARNPSRSPPTSANGPGSIEIFSPHKIGRREKTIVDWNGKESFLSKSISQERKIHIEKSRDEYEDELDKGRVKKQRISRSPSRETHDGNKFQSLQDKKKLVSKWSNILDGYGDGFKDHSTLKCSPNDKKPWLDKKSSNRPHNFNHDPQHHRQFEGNRTFNSRSSDYRNTYNGYNGNNRNRYQDNKNWKGRNYR